MNNAYGDYYAKPVKVELTEHQICMLLGVLDENHEVQRPIGAELAKHTSKEWQKVFDADRFATHAIC